MRHSFTRLKQRFKKHERFLLPAMLISGLIVDFITFKTIEIQTAFLILGTYLIIGSLAIAIIHYHDERHNAVRKSLLGYARLISPLIVQFTFGALLSASFIFYWFSGSISASWPIILFLTFLMVSNDVFREKLLRPSVQLTMYYFVLFSFLILTLPYAFNSLAIWVFLLAGIASFAIMQVYIALLGLLIRPIQEKKKDITRLTILVYSVMHILYFLNIIPPIPLSIREAGVFHSIQRAGSQYELISETQTFIEKITPGEVIHIDQGDPVYVWSSIFAPAELMTTIVHEWQFHDPDENSWVSRDKISFPITGGREDGYRGFSVKSAVEPGRWRVDVQTKRGQVLGRIYFKIEMPEGEVEFIQEKK